VISESSPYLKAFQAQIKSNLHYSSGNNNRSCCATAYVHSQVVRKVFLSSQQLTIIASLVIIAAIILVRLRTTRSGTIITAARIVGFLIIYLVVVIFVASISFLLRGIQIVYLIPYITVLCLTAYGSYRYSNNTLKFWKSTEGSIYVKGGFILYLIYIVALTPRIILDFIFIPQGYFYVNDVQQLVTINVTTIAWPVVISVDLLLIFGAGLLVGRNTRLLKRYRRIKRGEERISESP